MTEKARLKVAALLVALFLAAISAAGVLTHGPSSTVAVSSQTPSAAHVHPAQVGSHIGEPDSND